MMTHMINIFNLNSVAVAIDCLLSLKIMCNLAPFAWQGPRIEKR